MLFRHWPSRKTKPPMLFGGSWILMSSFVHIAGTALRVSDGAGNSSYRSIQSHWTSHPPDYWPMFSAGGGPIFGVYLHNNKWLVCLALRLVTSETHGRSRNTGTSRIRTLMCKFAAQHFKHCPLGEPNLIIIQRQGFYNGRLPWANLCDIVVTIIQ